MCTYISYASGDFFLSIRQYLEDKGGNGVDLTEKELVMTARLY
jgi:hypothetical protein